MSRFVTILIVLWGAVQNHSRVGAATLIEVFPDLWANGSITVVNPDHDRYAELASIVLHINTTSAYLVQEVAAVTNPVGEVEFALHGLRIEESGGRQNTVLGYHLPGGSSLQPSQVVSAIITNGFQKQYAQPTGLLGPAHYSTPDIGKALIYGRQRDYVYLFVVKVTLGRSWPMLDRQTASWQQPPPGFHSVTGRPLRHTEWAVYHDQAIKPIALIGLRRKAPLWPAPLPPGVPLVLPTAATAAATTPNPTASQVRRPRPPRGPTLSQKLRAQAASDRKERAQAQRRAAQGAVERARTSRAEQRAQKHREREQARQEREALYERMHLRHMEKIAEVKANIQKSLDRAPKVSPMMTVRWQKLSSLEKFQEHAPASILRKAKNRRLWASYYLKALETYVKRLQKSLHE